MSKHEAQDEPRGIRAAQGRDGSGERPLRGKGRWWRRQASQAPRLEGRRLALAQDAEGEPNSEVGFLPEDPYFPDYEDALAAHEQARAHYNEPPAGVREEGLISSALANAENHYYGMFGAIDADASPDPQQRLLEAITKMGYGIGESQPFIDGNKRTTRALMEGTGRENGLSHVFPEGHDDQELAHHINGWGIRLCPDDKTPLDENGQCVTCGQVPANGGGIRRHTPEQTMEMLKQRHLSGAPDPNYTAYPEDFDDFRTANILDPVHDTLDPTVWLEPEQPRAMLRPEHRQFIHDTVWTALDKHGYDGMDRWLSLYLTGSLTTYQYSDESDCDLSLFVDTQAFPEWSRAEMIGIMIETAEGVSLPGTTHQMQFFVVSKRFSPSDLYKPGLRSAYDLQTDSWLVPPDRSRVHDVEHEMNEAYTISLENADKMERLLRYEPDKAIMFWHQIHKRRMRDMNAGKGDYSPSNITYKMLNNRGLFPAISEVSGEYIA